MAIPSNFLPRAERFAIPITILYRSPGELNWRPGLTENISRSGVLFRADRHFPPNTPLEMMLDVPTILPAATPGITLRRGRVVRALSTSPLERRPAVAAAFLDTPSTPPSDPRRI